ncbi:MAG: hypothetical protein A2Z37_06995 [Chloroflexi bacterium RBG_19FT_COMBO_62_14]|nr:MAG: hypothetical protein A2Z37_06995 [Chloroflexi bacterium RBG_19FT_COMBO_62_14]
MVKWSDVIAAQRRWTDEIARADGRHGWRTQSPPRPARLVIAYRRALAYVGAQLVTLGCRLQTRYQEWTAPDEGRFSAGLRSDSLIVENNSRPCG